MVTKEPAELEIARSLRVSGICLAVLGVYSCSQWVALFELEPHGVVQPEVFAASSWVNCALTGAVALYHATLRVLRARRALSPRGLAGLTLALGVLTQSVWIYQLHVGGSQSCNVLMVSVSSLAVFAWLLPAAWLAALAGYTLAGMALVTALELGGVLGYVECSGEILR